MINHDYVNCTKETWLEATQWKPGLEIRRMYGKRYSAFYYSYLGREIAAKHESITRGKVTDISYHLYIEPTC